MFLLKPHITGPEGQVTSPDVIVDVLVVDGEPRPLSLLTHNAWQQTETRLPVLPAYGLMSLGGGAIILPALVLFSGVVVVARNAWRLTNLDTHIEQITLNHTPLADVELPANLIAEVGGTGDVLPRGYLLIRSANAEATEVTMDDPVLERSLQLKLHAEEIEDDRWGYDRPESRYSVGPTQKEVTHYI